MGEPEMVKVEITVLGDRRFVQTKAEDVDRTKKAASLVEEKVDEYSKELKKPMNERVPDQMFYAVLDIADQMLMLREQIETDKKSSEAQAQQLGQAAKSLASRFIKLKMAYGAERKESK